MTVEDIRFIVYGLISIGIGIVGILQVKQGKRVKRIQNQVENNHLDSDGEVINMREEADNRHNQNSRALKTIASTQKRMLDRLDIQNDKIDHVNKKVDNLYSRVDNNKGRIEDIEDTFNPWREKNNG